MAVPLLKTKLYIPPFRPGLVSRSRLIERLDEGLRTGRKLTLISAPAGFGKTTLVSDWIRQADRPVALAVHPILADPWSEGWGQPHFFT